MRLSLHLGYEYSGSPDYAGQVAAEAERVGCSVVWIAEAYGSDAVSMLAWLAARTSRMELGSAVLQIPARAPAMTAMTAASLDVVSRGRFRLGLGISGPRVSEGWYGVPFSRPLERTREYVELVRKVLTRRPTQHRGAHYSMASPDGAVLGLAVRAERTRVPIYLAALGPKNLELAGEIADGWLGLLLTLRDTPKFLARVSAGRSRAGLDMAGFDVVQIAPLVTGPDWRTCADSVRPYIVRYLGAMGSETSNFYRDMVARMGYESEAELVRHCLAAQDYDGALAAVPLQLLDDVCLLGPRQRIAERMRALAEVGVTTLAVILPGQRLAAACDQLRVAADALADSGVGD
ncbi:LLM class F420-dependent oxidoreductase [Actinosynnema sp. ALI-1.44]|uniref:LLM class flavin-dependent oxidoreductase n=1 Tax=Actinosynnema sp. ALI-1.44 TaxID=1933779 RepID=UPI00097BF9FB|nr:LLM class flavin-dependent oxidoreductase [Actinosynnema sp. ALI-1.44]ONI78121.1 LLM class F420-dependent oxidoreductase [Actinosynnema sp. ALI-1.44]